MPNVTKERRRAQRYPLVLTAEFIVLGTRTKLNGRASDIGRFGCYIDTLNPSLAGTPLELRLSHGGETFQTNARVVFVSPGLGMGVAFLDTRANQQELLDRWLAAGVVS